MCSICLPILPDFGINHPETRCPLRMSSYCSYCAKYGHLTADCPMNDMSPTEEGNQLRIKDNSQSIMAYLSAHSIKFPKGSHRKDVLLRKSILEEYADLHHMCVIYIK